MMAQQGRRLDANTVERICRLYMHIGRVLPTAREMDVARNTVYKYLRLRNLKRSRKQT